VVLNKEAVSSDVVAGNNHAVGRGVLLPADPVPWSARQIQVWSTMTSLELMARLTFALPIPAPPTRKKTSASNVGLLE